MPRWGNMSQEMAAALEDFQIVADDTLSAGWQTIDDALLRLGDLLKPTAPIGIIADKTLPRVDFSSWYPAQEATMSSMVGSGRLDWPRDASARLSMQVELFRALGSGQIDVISFCHTFLWSGQRHEDNVRGFVDQIARPFLRDIRRHIDRSMETEVKEAVARPAPDATTNAADPRKIFVVHGRDEGSRRAMFAFLRAIGLHPLEWSHAVALTGQGSPYIGDVIQVAFSHAQAVVVLLTPDDEVKLCADLYGQHEEDSETTVQLQPRPNVLFEAGMSFGFKPDRTILVELGQIKRFSDVAGRHALRLSDTPERRLELVERLKSAGCLVDVAGKDWLSTGSFAVERRSLALRGRTNPDAASASTPSVKYVDLNYPADKGLVKTLERNGYDVRWCMDDRLARALDIEGWQVVTENDSSGQAHVLKLHDKPSDQTLVMKRAAK